MIVFLCGPDDLRRSMARKFVVGEFSKKYPRGTAAVFGGEEDSSRKLVDFLRQNSLFEEKKLGVVQDLELYPELSKLWKEVAANKDTTLVVEWRKIPPKSWNLAKVQVVRQEFPELSGKEWKNFVSKQAKTLGAKLAPEALSFLSEIFEGDSWGVTTELQKFANLGREASLKDLALFGLSTTPEYWPLINGLKSWGAKDRLKALAILESENEPPAKTFNVLASTSTEKSSQFAEYDFQIKSGKLEYEEALLQAAL